MAVSKLAGETRNAVGCLRKYARPIIVSSKNTILLRDMLFRWVWWGRPVVFVWSSCLFSGQQIRMPNFIAGNFEVGKLKCPIRRRLVKWQTNWQVGRNEESSCLKLMFSHLFTCFFFLLIYLCYVTPERFFPFLQDVWLFLISYSVLGKTLVWSFFHFASITCAGTHLFVVFRNCYLFCIFPN